jgi:hypothetical protein
MERGNSRHVEMYHRDGVVCATFSPLTGTGGHLAITTAKLTDSGVNNQAALDCNSGNKQSRTSEGRSVLRVYEQERVELGRSAAGDGPKIDTATSLPLGRCVGLPPSCFHQTSGSRRSQRQWHEA